MMPSRMDSHINELTQVAFEHYTIKTAAIKNEESKRKVKALAKRMRSLKQKIPEECMPILPVAFPISAAIRKQISRALALVSPLIIILFLTTINIIISSLQESVGEPVKQPLYSRSATSFTTPKVSPLIIILFLTTINIIMSSLQEPVTLPPYSRLRHKPLHIKVRKNEVRFIQIMSWWLYVGSWWSSAVTSGYLVQGVLLNCSGQLK